MSRARWQRLVTLDTGTADVESEVDQELDFHIERTIADLVAAGRTPEEAAAEAARRLGDRARVRARLVDIDRGRIHRAGLMDRLQGVTMDLRHAIRGLLREPGLLVAIALTLGLGIGANTAMLGIVDRLLIRAPEHLVAPDRLVQLSLTEHYGELQSYTNIGLSWPDYTLARESGLFSDIAAMAISVLTLDRGPEASRIRVTTTTGSYWDVLGARAALGRLYTREEASPDSPVPVAVISDRFWTRRFGRSREALGSVLRIGEQRYTVVGIMPAGFNGLSLDAIDAWLPLGAAYPDFVGASRDWEHHRGWQWARLVGRMAPGETPVRIAEVLTQQRRALVATDPDQDQRAYYGTFGVAPGQSPTAPPSVQVAKLLAGVSLVVLLIACLNVANLLLARATRRRRDFAIRSALGITRTRLIGALMLESALLALLGGAAGVVAARWGGDAIRTFLLPTIDWVAEPMDLRVLAVALGATLLTAMVIGLIPALQASRPALTDPLRSGDAVAAVTRAGSRLRGLLLVVQTALSVMLLVGAGLFLRSLDRALNVDLGFEPTHLLTADVDAGAPLLPGVGGAGNHERAREALQALPGVSAVELAMTGPFQARYQIRVGIPGRDSIPRLPSGGPSVNAVTPGWAEAVGARLIAGRHFTDQDREGAPGVMIVNETMAELFWPGEEAVGKCLLLGAESPACWEIVGVVANMHRGTLREPPTMQYLIPLAQMPVLDISADRLLVVRTAIPAELMVEPVRRTLSALSPEMPWPRVQSMADLLAPHLQPWRLGATLLSLFGVLALVVAGVGLYGLLAYGVSSRRREFGVRSALGAKAEVLVGMVVRDGLRFTGIGLVLGAIGTFLASRAVAGMLFDTPPWDPVVLLGVVGILGAVTVVASWLPARRAARVPPTEALRES